MQEIVVVPPDNTKYCVAETRGAFANRIENRLDIGWRPVNDVEHLAGRQLIFEGFGKLPCARLLGLEQADVLDGDYRLLGEVV
jgi:hypothetical protein